MHSHIFWSVLKWDDKSDYGSIDRAVHLTKIRQLGG